MCPSSAFSTLFDLIISRRPLHPLQPSCHAPADPYVEHDALVIVLDLILLKPGVYRHLLFNRGMPPRKVEESVPAREQDKDGQQEEQRAEKKRVDEAAQDTARERVRTFDSVRNVIEPQYADVFFLPFFLARFFILWLS